MPFFSDTGPGGFQPKRAFRFLVTFSELSDLTFMVKSAAKPSYSMEPTGHQVLNHQFNFPGIVKWQPIDVVFIDAVDPNVGSKFYNALLNSGYVNPVSESALLTGITKVGTTSTIGEVCVMLCPAVVIQRICFGARLNHTQQIVGRCLMVSSEIGRCAAIRGAS